jgi:hypothetical protein
MSVIREERAPSPAPGLRPHAASGSPQAPARAHVLIVAALCAVAFGIELHFARLWHFGFDETWHVSIAAVEPFRQFVEELRWDSHPPLQYLLLRWLTPLHGSELSPRLVSMLASLGTILLAYLCALEIALSRPVALLAALLFAVSSTHLNVAICVRGYSLSTMLTMAAFRYFLRILRDPATAGRTDRLGFVLTALLAIWSESCAALVVLAALAVFLLEGLRRPGFLRALWRGDGLWASWMEPLVLFLGAGVFLGWLQWNRATGFVAHVSDCFRAKGEPLAQFAVRGFTATLDAFAPLGLPSARVSPLVSGLFLAVLGWLTLRCMRSMSTFGALRAAVILIIGQLWTAIFVLAAFEIYPYGGRMRHQFVLFPFLAFVLLLVLDEIYRWLRAKPFRVLLCVAFAAGTVATSLDGLGRGPVEEFSPTPTLWADEIGGLLHERQQDDAIYTTEIDAIGVFSHLRDYRWSLRQTGPDRLDLFTLEKEGSPAIRVLRESSVWWPPAPLDAAFAKRLAGSLRRCGIKTAWVVALTLEARPSILERTDDEPTRALLAAEGLDLDRRVVFESGEVLRVVCREVGSAIVQASIP